MTDEILQDEIMDDKVTHAELWKFLYNKISLCGRDQFANKFAT